MAKAKLGDHKNIILQFFIFPIFLKTITRAGTSLKNAGLKLNWVVNIELVMLAGLSQKSLEYIKLRPN